ncbi:MAG: poly-beta-hydroxybutyrate polymerase N-terminal domain-containing protein, partial [Arenibacterium sp.]
MSSDKPENHKLDQILHSAIGRLTGGISPSEVSLAWMDWAMHLHGSPSRQIELARSAFEKGAEAWSALLQGGAIAPDAKALDNGASDNRFR